MADTDRKFTRADLENMGMSIVDGDDVPAKEEIPDSLFEAAAQFEPMERVQREPIRPPQPKQSQDREIRLFLQVMTVALKVLSLRALLYGITAVSAVLFYQVVQTPEPWKMGAAVLFTVLVFLPTLFYSSKSK